MGHWSGHRNPEEHIAILICFSVTKVGYRFADTLKNFAEEAKAVKGDEVRDPDKPKYGPDIFLVGTKTELRGGAEEKGISPKEGIKLAKEINAVAYLECSTQENVHSVIQVFKDVAKCVQKSRKGKR